MSICSQILEYVEAIESNNVELLEFFNIKKSIAQKIAWKKYRNKYRLGKLKSSINYNKNELIKYIKKSLSKYQKNKKIQKRKIQRQLDKLKQNLSEN